MASAGPVGAESPSSLHRAVAARPVRIPLAVLASAGILIAAWTGSVYWRSLPALRHLNQGLSASESGRPLDAEREWKSALRLDPRRPEPYLLLAQLYLHGGRPDLAIPLLERLRELAPRYPHALCTLADSYTRAGETKKGFQTARQATLIEPNCARGHAIAGIHFGEQQDSRSAIAELARAVALAPGDDQIALSLAQTHLDASNLTAAEEIARDVLSRNPSYATAWYTLARSYARRTPTPGNLKEAVRSYEKAIEFNPALADAFAEIGRLKLLAGDPGGAIRPLQHLYSKGVRTKETLFNLAAAYRRLGDAARAEQMSRQFRAISEFESRYAATEKRFSIDPTNLTVALDLAELRVAAKEAEDALPLLQMVIEGRPRDPQSLRRAAALYERLGNRQVALALRQRLAALPKPS